MADESTRVCVLVLGMHRSGTSALTRILSLLGATLPARLLGASYQNPSGHWEPERLPLLHDEMLGEVGSSWDDWRPFDPSSLGDRLAIYRERVANLLIEEYGRAPLFVVKEPRISRFAPFFIDILAGMGVKTVLVHAYRNPLSVAASLQARNGFSAEFSQLVWLRYVLEAERASRLVPSATISYERLLEDWRSTTGPLLRLFPSELTEARSAEIDAFLNPEFRHHLASTDDLRGATEYTSWLMEAYAALAELSASPSTARLRLDHIRSELDAVPRFVSDAAVNEARTRSAILAKEREQTAVLLGDLAKLQREADEMARDLELTRSDLQRAKSDLLRSEQASVADHRSLGLEIENRERVISELRKSTSWRVTRPLRAVTALVGKNRGSAL